MSAARKNRVAIVVPELANGGGVPAVAMFLHRVLRESGDFDADLISLATSSRDEDSVRILAPRSWLRGPRISMHEAHGVAYRHAGSVGAELEYRRYRPRRALTRLLETYDLVQIVAGTPAWAHVARRVRRPLLLQAATLAVAERVSYLARTRGARGVFARLMTRAVDRLDRAAGDHVTAFFVENRWMLEMMGTRHPGKVVFAPPGLDTARFSPPAAPALNGFILSVGRWNDHRKNVRLLFDAYALLRAEEPSAPRLVLAGHTAPATEDWQYATALGIADAVDVRLGLTTDALAALYREASIFVVSSDEEGLGIAILEAMASGLPVVSTRCGGPEHLVTDGESGYLVPMRDAPALARRLRDLLADSPLRERMGRAARERAVRDFSLAAAGARFLETYRAIVASSAAGAGA
ncbi:MAG: glycosyltransferase family 4 protein [Gemmatimonadaceae bacterium]